MYDIDIFIPRSRYKSFAQWTDTDCDDFGKWMTDYMQYAGYLRPTTPKMFKMMMMTAFPPLWDTTHPELDLWDDYVSDPTRLLTKVDLLYASYNQMDKTNKQAAATFEHFQPSQAGPVGA